MSHINFPTITKRKSGTPDLSMSNTAGATSGERTAYPSTVGTTSGERTAYPSTAPDFVSVFLSKINVVHFVQLHDLHTGI